LAISARRYKGGFQLIVTVVLSVREVGHEH
jgi:hypothetical protein